MKSVWGTDALLLPMLALLTVIPVDQLVPLSIEKEHDEP